MYKCNKCGNISEFEEQNIYKTYINQSNDSSSDEYFYRENAICLNCESTLEDGDIIEDYTLNETKYEDSGYKALNEISNFCDNDCDSKLSCSEDDCVVFRIEKILSNNK